MYTVIKRCKYSVKDDEYGAYCRILDDWCGYEDYEVSACPMFNPEVEK